MVFSFKRGQNVHQQDDESGPALGGTGRSSRTPKRRGRALLRSAAVVLGVALLGATLTAPSAAAKPGADAQGAAPGGNCAIALGDGSTKAAAPTCFSTFTEAVRFATNGAVTNAPAAAADAANDPAFTALVESPNKLAAKTAASASAVAAASYLLSIEYDLTYYGGASRLFYGSHTCTGTTGDIDFYYDGLRSIGWLDRISSFKSYNNCWVDHYYWEHFATPHTGYLPGRPTMPVSGGIDWNNNTRSLRWS